MAKKSQAKKVRLDPRGRDLIREGLLLAALAAQALLLIALLTYGPDEALHRERVGELGHGAAAVIYGAFGVLSFLIVVLGLYTTVIAFVRKSLSAPVMRLIGAFLVVVGGCTLVFQFWDYGGSRASGSDLAGGALGEVLFDLFREPFGGIGTFLLAASLLCTGFAFATDWLIYEMLYDGARRAGDLLVVLKRFWPEPALAGGGNTATLPAPRTRPEPESRGGSKRGGKKKAAAEKDAPETEPETPAAVADAPATDVTLDDPEILVPAELLDGLAPLPESSSGVFPVEETTEAVAATEPEPAPSADDAADAVEAVVPSILAGDLDDDANDDPDVAVAADAPVLDDALDPDTADDEDESRDDTGTVPFQVHLPEPDPTPPAEVRFERPRGEGEYELPSTQLLDHAKPKNLSRLEKAIQQNAETLQRTLTEFKVEGRVVAYQQGPVVTMLEVDLAPGTKVTKIQTLSDDLAMALKAETVRIVAPIPGKSTVGVEIPNPEREDVRLPQLINERAQDAQKMAIPLFLGVAADGGPIVADLAKMPHLLLAGATGAGKSVCINTILMSVLLTRTPDDVKLILIDPKQVELSFFANVPHLLAPVVIDMKRAAPVLEWAVDQMEERYDLLRRFECRGIESYNELGESAIRERAKELGLEDEIIPIKLPYVVIVVDELADLMLTAGKDIEKLITRLAQKSRAVGIHIILATQRPSTDVITGLIKANMPTRIAFKVTSKVDSRVILDQNGADKLLGMGDMLYLPPRSSALLRAQGTYVSDKEVKRVVTFLKQRYEQEFNDELVRIGSAILLDDKEKDVLYDEAVKVVLHSQRGSASLLQRELGVGYTRASRLLDQMRKEGVVGAYKGSKASEVQMTLEEYERRVAEANRGS